MNNRQETEILYKTWLDVLNQLHQCDMDKRLNKICESWESCQIRIPVQEWGESVGGNEYMHGNGRMKARTNRNADHERRHETHRSRERG